MKTKIVVLTSFLATSIAWAPVMLTSNVWAEETGPEARQSVRETRRDDRQEAAEDRRDDRREVRGDQGDDHELLRLAVLAALRNGDFRDRQSVREERREGRQDRRDDRQEAPRRWGRRPRVVTPCGSFASQRGFWRSAAGQRGTSRGSPGTSRRSTRGAEERRDDRQECAAIGEATTSCYALRLLRRFATGILEIGSRSERNVARVARNVATIDKRGARNVGTIGESNAQRPRLGSRRPWIHTG